MAKKLRSLEGVNLDIFEAIKRALIRRGFVRQKSSKTSPKKAPPLGRLRKRLLAVTLDSHDVLFRTNTVFPFTLFPDTVVVDREKVTFISRYFFFTAKVTSIPIRDILSVEADIGPFFGSVHTASRYFITVPHSINWLWRHDAIQLQRLLQGYIIANEQEIDGTSIEIDKLVTMLNDLGQGASG
jgi:hypothetical protein